MVKRLLTLATDRIHNLPLLVLMPHSRCNCRCVMCDIWKANNEKRELTPETLQTHAAPFKDLGVREVVLSGGEALMHANLWAFCEVLKSVNIKITLLSTGLLLQKHAKEITTFCKEVIISLDGSEVVHDKIRNIPHGFKKLVEGVNALRGINPLFRVTGRCVLQRYNYFDFLNIVRTAKDVRLDQISFLAADISTTAFNRREKWSEDRVSEVALTLRETRQLDYIITQSFTDCKTEYINRFIAESPAKMKKIVKYYLAINGESDFPEPICNAPWVSAVVESDGSVLPCFFHKPYGNIFENNFLDILNSPSAIAFRKQLNVKRDATCKKCVCSLKLGVTQFN